MNQPLTVWARLMSRLAAVLLAVGLLPLLVVEVTGWNPLVAIMLSFTVAPLGAIALVVAAILFLAAVLRKRHSP